MNAATQKGGFVPIQGKYQAIFSQSDPTKALTAIGHLLHDQSFDPVPLDELGIGSTSYEARWSESCDLCGAIWIGTKAGEVLCIDLRNDGPRVLKIELDRGVRTLLHLHGANVFGPEHTLVVGTDSGFIHILREDGGKLVETEKKMCLASQWMALGDEDALSQARMSSLPRNRGAWSGSHRKEDRTTVGISAMARLRKEQSGASPILLATRGGSLFLLDRQPGSAPGPAGRRFRRLSAKAGWIQWILEIPESNEITCISRGGELVRISTVDPTEGITTEKMPFLPTAAAPFHHGFLLGTTEGLVYWGEKERMKAANGKRHQHVVPLPITLSPVLCIDRITIQCRDDDRNLISREYVVLGLASGKLRVIRYDRICDLAKLQPAPPTSRGRSVELGASILAVEVLTPTGDDLSRCYILATLSDHSLRLFHVDSIDNATKWSERHRRALWDRLEAKDNRRIAEALLEPAMSASDRDALWYFLILSVRHWGEELGPELRAWMLEHLPGFLNVASPAVLRLVALDLGMLVAAGLGALVAADRDESLARLYEGYVDKLLEISLALLRALPDRQPSWSRVAEQHLKVLNDLASAPAFKDDIRIVGWTRFVRKYVLRGATFSEKKLGLRSLVKRNYETHKYVDALVYQALLFERRNDLEWQAVIEGDVEIHSLHTTEKLVIAATRAGGLWFFSASGRPLRVVSDGVESSHVKIPDDGEHLLACVLAGSDNPLHLIVSWTSTFAIPGRELALGVFEIEHVEKTSSASEQVIVRTCDVELDPASSGRHPITVHSLCVVPTAPGLVLAGLDDAASHFGIFTTQSYPFSSRGDGWSLRLVDRAKTSKQPRAQPSTLASGKVPSRAITAASIDRRKLSFLAAIGSDNGQVSFVWFDLLGNVSDTRTASFPGPVMAIELSDESIGARHGASTRGCCIGTSTRETFAGSIPDAPGDVEPIWRETYDSPVIALQRWSTPLYDGGAGERRVLVTATEKGRICFHETRLAASKAPEISELNNYSFRGDRLDQVNLPSALRSFTVLQGTTDFVAAGPGGRIFKGSFCFTRDSSDHAISGSNGGLPVNMWRAFEAIRKKRIRYDERFFPRHAKRPDGADPDEREHEILGLMQLENGALRRYLLHHQLIGDTASAATSSDAIRRFWSRDGKTISENFRDRLARLRQESREGRQQIKIILKSLGGAFLDRRLESIRDETKNAISAPAISRSLEPEHDAVVAVAEAMTAQILDAARSRTRSAGKIRSTAFKELFRVQVFRHLALERGEKRPLRNALVAAINSCVRDDDHLVRVEVLRAMQITLRNIGVLHKELEIEPGAAERLKDQLFRGDVREIFWLVSLLTENLERYTDYSPGTPHATTWHYLLAFHPIFLLFPESALELCDFITRGGVPVAALEAIATKLTGKVGANVRGLISTFYVVPCLRDNAARTKFLNGYNRSTLEKLVNQDNRRSPSPEIAPSTEKQIAERLITIYHVLARFWEVEDSDKLAGLLQADAPEGPGTASVRGGASGSSPLDQAEKICVKLSVLAGEFHSPCKPAMAEDNAKTDAISLLQSEMDGPDYKGLIEPVRAITGAILAHWQSFYRVKVPGKGANIHGYRLHECLGEGGYGRVYSTPDADDGVERFAVKIFRHTLDPKGKKRRQFLAAERNHRTVAGEGKTRGVVPILNVITTPVPGYVMPLRERHLDDYPAKLVAKTEEAHYRHAVEAAADLGFGLSAAHRKNIRHGNIKPSNILVHEDGRKHCFELSDFDMAYEDHPRPGSRGDSNPPPSFRAVGPSRPLTGEWADAYALAKVLYNAFLRGGSPPLEDHAEEARNMACDQLATLRCEVYGLAGLVAALQGMFRYTTQEASTFLREICLLDHTVGPVSFVARRLTVNEIHELIVPLVEAKIKPNELFSGIRRLESCEGRGGLGLPTLLQDLTMLNELTRPWPDGEDPLVIWLKNAYILMHPRLEETIYLKFLREFGAI
ncbi:MAG: hypothetical protein ABJE95_05305 [Byssovorax sp.]